MDSKFPLHESAAKGEMSEVYALLTENPAAVSSRDEDGDTPLHCAAFAGQEAVADFLVGRGADLDARDQDGYTPLHAAVLNGHGAIVRLLLGRQCNIQLKDNQGKKPLDYAGPDIRTLIKKSSPSRLPMIFVVCACTVPILFTIVGVPMGVDINFWHWGFVNGYGPGVLERALLEPLLGWETARSLSWLDISNPAPFTLTLFFLIAAWVASRVTKKRS